MNTPTLAAAPRPAMSRASRRTLGLLALVCTLPVIASYAAFYLWRPQATANHGELLPPRPLLLAPLQAGAEAPVLRGRWTLIYAGPAACDEVCRHALWLGRQARTAQGKEMERVGRLWLVSDGGTPAADDPALQSGLALARPAAGETLAPGLYLADPLGQVMLAYGAAPEPRGLVRDLQRLLKYSGLR